MPEEVKRFSRRVVVIDDSPDDLFLLRRTLVRTGLADTICTFEQPAEAVEYFAACAKSEDAAHDSQTVVFCDLKMPELDGFAVLQWIRAQEFSPRISVVIVSGCALQADVERARELGADGYLEKMPSAEILRSCFETPTFPPTGSRSELYESWEAAQNAGAR